MKKRNSRNLCITIMLTLALVFAMGMRVDSVFADDPDERPDASQDETLETESSLDDLLQDGSSQVETIINETLKDEITAGDEWVKFADDSRLSDVRDINITFLDTGTKVCTWDFPYSNDFFRYPSDEFSLKMAQASFGLTVSAFRSDNGVLDLQYKKYLRGAGFRKHESFGYDEPTSKDTISGVIARKNIDDVTVIAVVTCGLGYGGEWESNLEVGDEDKHYGFSYAAAMLEGHIDKYIKDHKITGPKKLWITGFSRASAIANITAAHYIEEGSFDDVYAYCFAVPRTTKDPVKHPGIYNIISPYDPVPQVPLSNWGYNRYGTDLFLPSQETSSSFADLYDSAEQVASQVLSDHLRFNPEVNYQLGIIVDVLKEMYESSGEYVSKLQRVLMKTWTQPDLNNMIEVLTATNKQLDSLDNYETRSSETMMDYVSYMVSQHAGAENQQEDEGSWNNSEDLSSNLLREHRMSTYMSWLFSSNEAGDILSSQAVSRRIVFVGKYDVSVERDGVFLGTQYADGTRMLGEGVQDIPGGHPGELYMSRVGDYTVVSFPNDTEYKVTINVDKLTTCQYYDVVYDRSKSSVEPGTYYVGTLKPGSRTIMVSPGEALDRPYNVKSRKNDDIADATFTYSPLFEMAFECKAAGNRYLSISRLITLAVILAVIAIALLVSSFYFAISHYRKVKRGHRPFATAYAIVPHMIVIYIFAGLTQLLTHYMFSVGRARAECAALTVFAIFLMSIQATARRHDKVNAIISIGLLVLAWLTLKYYDKLYLSMFSVGNIVLYFAIVTALSVLVIMRFPRRKKEGSRSDETPPSTQALQA